MCAVHHPGGLCGVCDSCSKCIRKREKLYVNAWTCDAETLERSFSLPDLHM